MRVALRLTVAAALLVVAAGCASVGQGHGPSLASEGTLVWDCGWRVMP